MNGTIYALVGPEGVKYVGQTRRTLAARYAQHAKHARIGEQWRVSRWWRSLETPPEITVLERCDADDLNDREIAWIAHYRGLAVDLCNHTEGGQNECPDAETRERMSASAKRRFADPSQRAWLRSLRVGSVASEETRAKMSRSIKAVRGTPESRAKTASASKGHVVTAEARARIGAANRIHRTGTTLPLEVRAKIGAAQRGKKLSPETVERMRVAQQARRSRESTA